MTPKKIWHVVIDENGVVTLPRELREQLELMEGSQVDVVEEDDAIVQKPIASEMAI